MARFGWMMGVGAMAVVGCDDGANGNGLAMTQGQLAERLAGGAVRLEVELNADGSVREVEVEDELGHEAQVEGRVTGFDAATGKLTLAVIGEVDGSAVTRFRTEDDSNVAGADWQAAVSAALALGEPVWVDARGGFAGVVFGANELRWEDDAETKIEADVTAEQYDEATGLLTIGSLQLDISDALIRAGDDSDEPDDRDDSSDDDGTDDRGGDDDGTDDRGGDDDGTDDRGGDDDGTDDRGGDDDAAGDDNGAGADDAAGDDNGAGADDAAGDDNGAGDDGEAEAPHDEGAEAEGNEGAG